MSQLASKSIAAIYHLSVDDNTRAYARTKCQHNEILHASGHSIGHLADSCGIGIVGQRYGHT